MSALSQQSPAQLSCPRDHRHLSIFMNTTVHCSPHGTVAWRSLNSFLHMSRFAKYLETSVQLLSSFCCGPLSPFLAHNWLGGIARASTAIRTEHNIPHRQLSPQNAIRYLQGDVMQPPLTRNSHVRTDPRFSASNSPRVQY